VRLSSRLTDSVAALVADEHALGRHMRRLMEAQGGATPLERRALELNLDHPLVGKLEALAARDADAGRVADYAELLYGQALLAEGSPLPDPARFGRLVSELMASGLDA
jgi:molecular chaperone HtpG